ncbi:cation-transporting P-type ATPase [Nitrosomonas sp. ANs5]|uniref:cation-transporting P-type ATPase n=1 Tax=Nitrosomonas sp. ANs5 TaxID=3423941 RepID=UPI003D354E5F
MTENHKIISTQPWHAHATNEVLDHFESDPRGLTQEEAAHRLDTYGRNRLKPAQRRGPFKRFLVQFHNVLIYVLLAAAAVTAMLGHLVDTGVILGVVLVNSIIGFIQEGKAERALDAIRDMLSPHAVVRREGQTHEIPAEEVVPGDIVLLVSGDKVPADLRLFEVRTLKVDEAVLTGESEPVEKHVNPVEEEAGIGDRLSMAYSGTLVTYGQAAGVVIATGEATEIGRISAMIAKVEEISTPLTRKMGKFAHWLTGAILVFATLTFTFGIYLRDYTAADMFLAAVSLAVAAIPEGLPAIMTITLAIGVQRMAGRHAIIRRLPAVETLGSVTVICSDKTGTLTRNEMTVQNVMCGEQQFSVTGVGYAPHGDFLLDDAETDPDQHGDLIELARAGLLCNDARLRHKQDVWELEGDPTEGALITLALKARLDPASEQETCPRTDVIPFESEHRFMATLHHDHDGHVFAYVKGAPERVLAMCGKERHNGCDRELDRERWESLIDHLASQGERVLAIATKCFDNDKHALQFGDVEDHLTLLGLVGIIDPPRDEAIVAVKTCREAGIRVKMITGDHLITARAIGKQLGIGDGIKAVEGKDIESLDDVSLRKLVAEVDVFARSSPEHKLRLVEALQANDEVVAMTGDGVNDAPALKRADVGVAMGVKGTEAAKEAAEMVLADDNFASIERAIEEGRTVYDNLKKSITFLLPINGGESGALIAAIIMGATLPITPVQILWVNMVSSVALALALAFEPTEPNVMRRAPRPVSEPILSGFLIWRIALVSTLFLIGIFGMFELALMRGAALEEARTIAVNTLVSMEVFYLFSVRYLRAPSFTMTGIKGTKPVLMAVATVLVLQLMFTYAPFMEVFFGTRPLAVMQGIEIVLAGVVLLVILESEKWLRGLLGFTGESSPARPR